MPNPRRSRDDWRHHIDAWRCSGLSSHAYAERHGLHPATFKWWRSQLSVVTSAPPPARPITLVPVQVAPPSTPGPNLEISLPNGITFRVPPLVDPARVAALVRALDDGC
jgi:transposase-like protein